MADRYEINHNGQIVVGESALCSDLDQMLIKLFSQFGWTCRETDKTGACRRLELTDSNGNIKFYNVYCGTIRNEARNAYEKKIQLGTASDPKTKSKKDTIILGIYVYEANDSIQDAIFVGYPIDDNIRYDTNPSIRGTFVNKILIQAKNEGFVYDEEHNSVAFRSEFAFYYLANYYNIHYSKKAIPTMSDVEYENEDEVAEKDTSNRAKFGANKIFYGAPGCGKSRHVSDMLAAVPVAKDNIVRVTFHPEYANCDFIGQVLPTVETKTDEATGEEKEIVKYIFNPGPFTLALQTAYDTNDMVFLIVEEINRGNAAAIFGDMFQLLDRVRDSNKPNYCGSEYPVSNPNMQKYLIDSISDEAIKEELKNGIFIPSNLTIYATMNSSDQNVFTLDTAFKRRWSFEQISNDITKDADHSYRDWLVPGTTITWADFLTKLNLKILDYKLQNQTNEDKRLGKYFVTKDCLVDPANIPGDVSEIAQNFAYKVLEYVWNDVCKIGREEWFDTEHYKTLEDLIETFVHPKEGETPLSVFQNITF